MLFPQIYKENPRPGIPPLVVTSSAMGIKLGVFGFLPTTHAIQVQNKCVHDLRAPCSIIMHIYLHAQTAVDLCRWHTHLMNHGYFDYVKNRKTPNLSPMPGWKWRRFWDLPCISVVISEVVEAFFIYIGLLFWRAMNPKFDPHIMVSCNHEGSNIFLPLKVSPLPPHTHTAVLKYLHNCFLHIASIQKLSKNKKTKNCTHQTVAFNSNLQTSRK